MSLRHAAAIRYLETRLRDPARMRSFFRFLAKRFFDDSLFESAGALSYTTAFALVPLSMVVFGVLSAFPVFDRWSDQLSHYIFANFVPSAARSVEGYLREFSKNTGQLTAAGVIALVISLLVTLASVEGTFNRIWRVPTARPKISRFLVYWTVLTLGALVATASLSLSARFFALAIFESEPGQRVETFMLQLAPFAIEWLAFAALFKVVPHRTVAWRHAIAGGLLSALCFELVKAVMGAYLGNFGSYQKIYGPLAFFPIFLLWIYVGWLAVLLGASFAASLSAFRYQPAAMRLPEGYEIYALLRMLGRFEHARRDGRGLHIEELQQLDPLLTDALVMEMLAELDAADIVARAETGEWILTRDLDTLTLADLYEACNLRLPINEARLPCRDDPLGTRVGEVIDELRLPLRDVLRRKVSTIYEDLPA